MVAELCAKAFIKGVQKPITLHTEAYHFERPQQRETSQQHTIMHGAAMKLTGMPPPRVALQVRVDFDQPGLPRRVKQSGKWLSQHVLNKSTKT